MRRRRAARNSSMALHVDRAGERLYWDVMKTADGIEKVGLDIEASVGSDEASPALSWKARLLRELRSRPFGYIVLGLFVMAGPVLAPLIFPQAPTAVAVIGGLAFGAYAALCAVPQKFL